MPSNPPLSVIACRDCDSIQALPPLARGRLECHACGRVLESRTGRSIDAALACSIATLLLLVPADSGTLMTAHIGSITTSSHLAGGLRVAWRQGWPLVTVVLALEGIVLPYARFGLLAATLIAVRLQRRGSWLGRMFRLSEQLDQWAMFDVLLIGGGIGYGRMAAQLPVTIGAGGWCFVAAAAMTMITRASLERREVWRRIYPDATDASGGCACNFCELLLPGSAHGTECPRCGARVWHRKPFAIPRCAALTAATLVLMPIAYGYPMSALWRAGVESSNTVISGIERLFTAGFWYFGVIIFCVSVLFPLTKLVGLIWFMYSVHAGSSRHLRGKTALYRFIDEVGRWSTLDPFTVMIFTPMIQFGQLAHFDFMGGAAAFLATVVLSMLAANVFDPRLMWDAARRGRPVAAPSISDTATPFSLNPSA